MISPGSSLLGPPDPISLCDLGNNDAQSDSQNLLDAETVRV
jgi:hypothetical protein